MDEGDLLLSAELTKINILLEHLWTSEFVRHSATPAEVSATGEHLVQLFEEKPIHQTGNGIDPALDEPMRSLVAQRLAEFFANLRNRFERQQGRS